VVRLNRPFNGVLHIVLEALQQQFHFDVTVWVMLTRILKFLTYISDAVREMPNLCKTNCSMASNFFSAVAELSHCYRRLPWWCPLPSEFRFRFRWFWGSWRRKQLLWAYWICFFESNDNLNEQRSVDCVVVLLKQLIDKVRSWTFIAIFPYWLPQSLR
jgi:hypothetical protein